MFEKLIKLYQSLSLQQNHNDIALPTRDDNKKILESKQYGNMLEAYHRSFIDKDGCICVGNHRLSDDFSIPYFIHSLARNKQEGKHDNYLIDTWFQKTINGTSFYMLVIKATGERLNTMIPYAKEPATFKNFLEQLHQEYKKNLADILTEKSHE
jgi:hypothetical protein